MIIVITIIKLEVIHMIIIVVNLEVVYMIITIIKLDVVDKIITIVNLEVVDPQRGRAESASSPLCASAPCSPDFHPHYGNDYHDMYHDDD